VPFSKHKHESDGVPDDAPLSVAGHGLWSEQSLLESVSAHFRGDMDVVVSEERQESLAVATTEPVRARRRMWALDAGPMCRPMDSMQADRAFMQNVRMVRHTDAWHAWLAAQGNPAQMITVLRGVPNHVSEIDTGAFVADNFDMASRFGDRVLTAQVRAGDLYSEGLSGEYGYQGPRVGAAETDAELEKFINWSCVR